MLDVHVPKRVLAIGAHPDDLELMVGGTLARFSLQGTFVSMAIATDGSAGHASIEPKRLAEIRRNEAELSAAIIKAEFHWLGYSDELLFEDIPTRMKFVDLIRSTYPEIILTHNPFDYHPDHRVVSKLVFDASFVSSLPGIKSDVPAHQIVPSLYYFDSINGINFEPEEYVDITNTYEIKKKMLECHSSQLKDVDLSEEVNYLDMIQIHSRFRGLQCGTQYAEGFIQERCFPRLHPWRALP